MVRQAKQKKPVVASGKGHSPGPRRAKPVVGFYDLTGCQGCLLSFIFNEDEFLDLANHVDIKAFRFVKGAKEEKQFDIVFVEGLVANNKDLEILQNVRSKTKILVSFGACACTGCIPAYRNFMDTSKYAYLVYEKIPEARDLPATPINEHVQVDYFLPGCPPDKHQIADFIKDLLLGKNPYDYDKPVCFECRLNENRCLLKDNKMCLGAITRGGCNSICTNGKLECWGCRGRTPDANVPLMVKLLEEKGFKKEHIRQRIRTFAGMQMEKPTLKVVLPKKPKRKQEPKKPKPKKAKAKKVKKTPKKKAAKRRPVRSKSKKTKGVKPKKARTKPNKKAKDKKKGKSKTRVRPKRAKKVPVKRKQGKKKTVKKKIVKKKQSKKKPAKKSRQARTKAKPKKARRSTTNKKPANKLLIRSLRKKLKKK